MSVTGLNIPNALRFIGLALHRRLDLGKDMTDEIILRLLNRWDW